MDDCSRFSSYIFTLEKTEANDTAEGSGVSWFDFDVGQKNTK